MRVWTRLTETESCLQYQMLLSSEMSLDKLVVVCEKGVCKEKLLLRERIDALDRESEAYQSRKLVQTNVVLDRNLLLEAVSG